MNSNPRLSKQILSNGLTVDVEEWFHILEVGGPRIGEWNSLPSRVERNTDRLLEVFSTHGVKATFFFMGWIAERHPDLVRRIARENHEISTHGYAHELVSTMGVERFRNDLHRSVEVLEGLASRTVVGYRAPGFSISNDALWAFDVLAEQGLLYDASVCPARHTHGGIPGYPTYPYLQRSPGGRTLWEFPVSCLSLAGWRLPFSGGGYLRLLPYWFISSQIRRFNRAGHPVTIYVHPREIDPNHPRLPMSYLRRFKSYINLQTTLPKLHRLLDEFSFKPLQQLLPPKTILRQERVSEA